MNRVISTCIDCGEYSFNRRCEDCEAAYQQIRNRLQRRKAYADPEYRSQPKTGICHICGEDGADTRDHVIPLSKGGTNHPSNVKPAHRSCNSAKGTRA